MKKIIIKTALLNACATVLYISIVVSLIFYAPKIFGSDKADTVFIPIAMLCLFVFSAGLTGFLMFGRPILWYLDGKKEEALSLLAYTFSIFLVITIMAFFALLLAS
jgi:hypothetical protein